MLTERVVRDAKPGPKAFVLWDGQIKGLGCRVFPSGHKAYVLSYRRRDHKRLSTLGRCSELSLRQARERAGEELSHVRTGGLDPLGRRRELREAPTVNDALKRFFDETVPQRIAVRRFTERTGQEYRWNARRYVAPALGTMPVSEVTRDHVEKLAATLADRPAQRNRVLAFLSRLFTLTERWEWRRQHSNPVRGIERGREEPRARILSPEELAALSSALKAAQKDRPVPVAAIRVAALTGLRIGEVLAMRWEDLDLRSGRARLPSTKTGARVHDLPGAALDELKGLPRINEFVFTSGRPASMTYRTVRRHFLDIVAAAGLKDVRLHDLRRTLITTAAASGESVFIIRGLLGHATTAIAARYVQEAGLDVREARERAGSAVAAMMDAKPFGDGRDERG